MVKDNYDVFAKLIKSISVNDAWRQHAQAKTGGEMVSALMELARVGELQYLAKEKK